MSSINYRIINDNGQYMASRPWHVESDIGYGFGLRAVCKTEQDAKDYIEICAIPHYPEDSLGLGELNN